MKAWENWLKLAEIDLKGAKKLFEDESLENLVLFHSQQCIEKSLKAILEKFNKNVPKTHNIEKLTNLINQQLNIKIPLSIEEIEFIDSIYIDSRYPGYWGILPSGFPSKNQCLKILKLAENILNFTKKLLEVKNEL